MDAAALVDQYGFACVALLIFAGEVGVPVLVPGELLLLLVGGRLIHSVLALIVACLAFAAVDFCAAGTLHLVARSGGNRLLRVVLRRVLKGDRRAEDVLAGWRTRLGRHDALVIFGIRSVPGIRISASLVSGLLRLPPRDFVMGAAPAALLWASVPLILGYALRGQIASLRYGLDHLVPLILALTLLLILMAGGRWWIIRQRGDRAKPRRGIA